MGTEKKCDKWSKLEKLIWYVSSFHNPDSISNSTENSIDNHLKLAAHSLNYCKAVFHQQEENVDTIKLHKIIFLEEQINLLLTNAIIRYSPELIIWACTLFYTHPSVPLP